MHWSGWCVVTADERAWFRTEEEEISSSFGSPSCPRAATVTVTETCMAVAAHFGAGGRSPADPIIPRVSIEGYTLTTTCAGILLPPTPIKESRFLEACDISADASS
jgi:hypothetical protein